MGHLVVAQIQEFHSNVIGNFHGFLDGGVDGGNPDKSSATPSYVLRDVVERGVQENDTFSVGTTFLQKFDFRVLFEN
jgi:hypothetical protein